MTGAGSYTAVVDRFEGDEAVLVAERRGDTDDSPTSDDSGLGSADRGASGDADLAEFVIPRALLPVEARHPDAVLELAVDTDTVTVTYRADETANRRERARERFERLSKRPPSADDPD